MKIGAVLIVVVIGWKLGHRGISCKMSPRKCQGPSVRTRTESASKLNMNRKNPDSKSITVGGTSKDHSLANQLHCRIDDNLHAFMSSSWSTDLDLEIYWVGHMWNQIIGTSPSENKEKIIRVFCKIRTEMNCEHIYKCRWAF